MIATYVNRVFGLIGAVRVGKGSVANFLTETRGFKQIAFADQIKEEFGISKADFEAAKIAGNIEELRSKLWEFSAAKKKDDPLYFIKKVIDKAQNYDGNVIITDIRTEQELIGFYNIKCASLTKLKRVYWVRGDPKQEIDKNDKINGSKLLSSTIAHYINISKCDLRPIYNNNDGLYAFYQQLDKFFFIEDVEDIQNNQIFKDDIRLYLGQFEIKLKESK